MGPPAWAKRYGPVVHFSEMEGCFVELLNCVEFLIPDPSNDDRMIRSSLEESASNVLVRTATSSPGIAH